MSSEQVAVGGSLGALVLCAGGLTGRQVGEQVAHTPMSLLEQPLYTELGREQMK